MLQIGEITHHLTLYRFNHAIEKLVLNLRRNEDPPHVEKRTTIIIWLRLHRDACGVFVFSALDT
ncbi:MAG: hypothetical protein NVS2B12_41560 [Ktedonobacteraceae bacterium]